MPLDAKAVELKGRDLTKAAESSTTTTSDASTPLLLQLLQELRSGVAASEQLLRTTKIGVTVNKLKQHRSPQVKQAAAELVGKWRVDVQKAGRLSAGGAGGAGAASSSGASTPKMAPGVVGTTTAAAAAARDGGKGARPDVPKEKRNVKTDGVNYKCTGNDTRDNCVKLMYDGVAFMSEDSPDNLMVLAKAIESATYNVHQPETSEAYKTRIRSLYQNLKSKTNAILRTRVQSGEIEPKLLATMSHDDMKSEERKAEDAKLMKENMDKAMVAQPEHSISDHLRCGKCGQKKVTYTQAQTRSADEPMTTFCTCLNCGNRWKFS